PNTSEQEILIKLFIKKKILIKLGFPSFGQIPSLTRNDEYWPLRDRIWDDVQHES
ncbi:hypothetical protein LINPERPRIM_LOCUS37538, partial [Linum perenne]